MTTDEKLQKIVEHLAAKKTVEDKVKVEYKGKEKVKALTTAERLDRLERLAGLK